MSIKQLRRKTVAIQTKGGKRPLYRVSLVSILDNAPELVLEELTRDIDGVDGWSRSEKFEDCLYCLMANGEMKP